MQVIDIATVTEVSETTVEVGPCVLSFVEKVFDGKHGFGTIFSLKLLALVFDVYVVFTGYTSLLGNHNENDNESKANAYNVLLILYQRGTAILFFLLFRVWRFAPGKCCNFSTKNNCFFGAMWNGIDILSKVCISNKKPTHNLIRVTRAAAYFEMMCWVGGTFYTVSAYIEIDLNDRMLITTTFVWNTVSCYLSYLQFHTVFSTMRLKQYKNDKNLTTKQRKNKINKEKKRVKKGFILLTLLIIIFITVVFLLPDFVSV